MAGGKTICNPEFLSLFMITLENSPESIQLRGVQDLAILLTNSHNCDSVLSQYCWASFFFPLLIAKATLSSTKRNTDTTKAILDGVLGILSLLHVCAFRRGDMSGGRRTEYTRSGWEVLQNTLVHFQMTCNDRKLNGMAITWSLLEQLIHLFQRDADKCVHCHDLKTLQALLYGSVFHFLPFVEEHIFFPPAQAAGSKSIIAIPDTSRVTGVPTFSFAETTGVNESSTLIYSTVKLLSCFPLSWLMSSNSDKYSTEEESSDDIVRIYLRLLLIVIKDCTRAVMDGKQADPRALDCVQKLRSLLHEFEFPMLDHKWKTYFVQAVCTLVRECEKTEPLDTPSGKEWKTTLTAAFDDCCDAQSLAVSGAFPNHGSRNLSRREAFKATILGASTEVLQTVERTERNIAASMVDSRNKMMQELEKRLLTLRRVQKVYEKQSEGTNAVSVLQEEELLRISDVLVQERYSRKTCERRWHKILRQSTSERGPWGSNEDLPEGRFWKLAEFVDVYNCRRKIVRNPTGTDYSSILSNRTQSSEKGESKSVGLSEGMLQSDLWQELLEYSKEQVEDAFGSETDVEDSAHADATFAVPSSAGNSATVTLDDVWVVQHLNETPASLTLSPQNFRLLTKNSAPGSSSKPCGVNLKIPSVQEWDWTTVVGINKRRYQMCSSAVEISFQDGASMFLDFGTSEQRKAFFRFVQKATLPNYDKTTSASPKTRLRISDATERWRKREMSNFDYLMVLNDFAGRNYHDLSQYPVFPWVISNYSSTAIDLSDESNFRDLSKPVGAQTKERERLFRKKYQETKEMCETSSNDEEGRILHGYPRHYATHYSSPHTITWFMLRVEPFTTLSVDLAGGTFDKADRQFQSIAQAWESCSASDCLTDVKELIPEMYYFPDMLRNTNRAKFGKTQTHEEIDNVLLPRWANESPEQFVKINRMALESEYVSAHLHEWIDLIFGYKQRGPYLNGGSDAAVDACNIYFHLSYEDAVDAERLRVDRPDLFHMVKNVVNNFGQSPTVLFERPHLPRRAPSLVIYKLFSRTNYSHAPSILLYKSVKVTRYPITFIAIAEKLVVVNSTRCYGLHDWQTLDRDIDPPFTMSVSKSRMQSLGEPTYGPQAKQWQHASSCLFATSANGKTIFSCGHWDGTFKATQLATNKVVQSIKYHFGIVSCIAVSHRADDTFWESSNGRSSGYVLVTGSRDCTVAVWSLNDSMNRPIMEPPLHILVGHDATVTSLAVDVDLGVLLSGSDDGTAIMYDLSSSEYVRTLRLPETKRPVPVRWIGINLHGQVVVCQGDAIALFSLNGIMLAKLKFQNETLTALRFNEDGNFLVAGGTNGILHVLSLVSDRLIEVDSISCGDSISSFYYTPEERHLLVGLASGILQIRAVDNEYLRVRLKDRLETLGFGTWER